MEEGTFELAKYSMKTKKMIAQVGQCARPDIVIGRIPQDGNVYSSVTQEEPGTFLLGVTE